MHFVSFPFSTVYSGYSGHIHSGYSGKMFQKYTKSFLFFSNKIKTRAYIKYLRYSTLWRDVFDISEKFQYQVYNIKQEILGQKIKVKIYFPEKLKMFNTSNI